MVPGMQHCGRGPGADSLGAAPGLAPEESDPSRNMTIALERWVEKGTAPSAIVATKYNSPAGPSSGVKFTRPLCPHPAFASEQLRVDDRRPEKGDELVARLCPGSRAVFGR
jgi:feruloyl esterase